MNNFFERNVRLLFPQEFDWEKTEYNDLKNFKLSTNDYREQVNTNPLTITDILQKKAKCNLRIDLSKTTRIENLNLSEIDEVSGKFQGAWIGEIETSGRCIGGCLDVLKDLFGTPYDTTKQFLDKKKKAEN